MASDDHLRRLQHLQRDLAAFTESRLPNLERLAVQLESSVGDFRKLLAKKKRNDASRSALQPSTGGSPDTVKIDEVEYRLNDQFRHAALLVADDLDLDELEAAKLCMESQSAIASADDTNLPLRAVVNFHEGRAILLDCLRLLLQLSLDPEDNRLDIRSFVKEFVQGEGPGQVQNSAYWRKCMEGLSEVEAYLKKIEDHRQMTVATGQRLSEDQAHVQQTQHQLVMRQHECLVSVLTCLIHGNYVQPEDFRAFLSKAASLEAHMDITIHYIPVLVSGAHHFASDLNVSMDAAKDLHNLFAAGPGQLQWKQPAFKAAATVLWLAEYSSRFVVCDNPAEQAEYNQASKAALDLFFDSLKLKAFHFLLATATLLKPVVWFEPSRVGLVEYLLNESPPVSSDALRASDDFSTLTMRELQNFTDAFVTNMPDAVRKLKTEEDERRRDFLNETSDTHGELDLERFMVIMACAYQDDPDATRDFWSDRESNLYGFLRWCSQRLPTPRVAAFCQLLRSIACDEKSANHAHLFLVEDTVMTAGKLRKTYAISWAQIFSEFEIYAASLKDTATRWETRSLEELNPGSSYTEPETGIMLDSYLGLATHICRTSPDARNWILKEQQFHIGEVILELASTHAQMRIRACCMDLLSALLIEKIPEVRNGMWALLDEWLLGENRGKSVYTGPPSRVPKKRHLEEFTNSAEASDSLVNLFNALTAVPHSSPDGALDTLPFPEQLGMTNRYSGMDRYVDFVLQVILAHKVPQITGGSEADMVNVLRSDSLEFILICLSSFNEDLVSLANTTNVGIEEAMETKSLLNYVKLHPFARIMEWILNADVTNAIFAAIQPNAEMVDNAQFASPLVQSTLKAVQVLNLAWKLQATYFDIVRPLLASNPSRVRPIPGSVIASIDELFLPRLNTVHDIARLTTSRHLEVSLESLALFERICDSRKLNGGAAANNARGRAGNRVLTAVIPTGPALTLRFGEVFLFDDYDFEQEEITPKYTKAQAILKLLSASLNASDGKPSIAHCLLGFECSEGKVEIVSPSAFASGASLFHEIARCAVEIPVASRGSRLSWLLSMRRGCTEIILKLATSPLTAYLTRRELQQMFFLESLARKQFPTTYFPLWDFKHASDPNLLLDSSSLAVRDFMRTCESVFELYAVELRSAAEAGSYSIQEKLISMMRGAIITPDGAKIPVASVFDLFDFFELQITDPSDVERKILTAIDFSACMKADPDASEAYDIRMAEELLYLKKRELTVKGQIKEGVHEQFALDEISATVAALNTQNNWRAIQNTRLAALESWTDLLSLMVARGGTSQTEGISLALQGLLVALPPYEKSLQEENQDAAALLAKLILTLTNAITPALQDPSLQTANVAMDRLQSVFRASLKAITDSSTDLALRDVCYRTCCAILAAVSDTIPKNSPSAPSAHKQLLQLAHGAGDRLITVITEDTFSGRGITRISALLFLDGLVALFQDLKVSVSMLRSLTKLNFVPVLIDTSIGSISSIFGGEDELVVSLSYFHTALALLLRLCQTPEGTQLVLNSNLFEAIDDSNLFSTDPDIGFDIDNAEALKEFYRILTEVLRVVTAAVLTKGPQAAKGFLQTYRPSVQAIFKRTSRESGPPELISVADEMGKLILATGFLEVSD